MDVLEAIDTRASAAKLGEPAPSHKELSRIMRSALRAPDHGRLVPWRFIVLREAGQKVLGDLMAEVFRRKTPEATEEQLEAQRNKARRAPVVIVVAATVRRNHKVPEIEQQLAVAAGVQNMLLTAHALGYGTMWKTGAPAYDPQVKVALGLGEDDYIISFLYVGTPLVPGNARPTELTPDLVRYL